ncbi:unnamed protein product, partial [Brassica napus]
ERTFVNGFSLDFLSAAEENKKSLTVLSPVRLRPVTGGSPLPLLLFFLFAFSFFLQTLRRDTCCSGLSG